MGVKSAASDFQLPDRSNAGKIVAIYLAEVGLCEIDRLIKGKIDIAYISIAIRSP